VSGLVVSTIRPPDSGISELVIQTPRLQPSSPATVAALAVDALRAEALLTPKPGLVDGNGPGSHQDMNLAMLLTSAESLFDAFTELACIDARHLDDQTLRDQIGVIGRHGEAAMLEATGGVNTHRGALWTLGLLLTAAQSATTEPEVFDRAAALARTPDSVTGPVPSSHGQRAVRTYGVPGAVGEAAAGFPSISRVALPTMRAALNRGESTDRARLRALLALIATVEDTCILHRGGTQGLRWIQRSARRVESAHCFDNALRRFAADAQRRRLSPGGSGDLLAGMIFVHSLDRPGVPAKPTPIHERAVLEFSHADL
jgi:triphosphoribosyl-dephospho-CoA synthase